MARSLTWGLWANSTQACLANGVEKEDDLSLSDLSAHANYRPSTEISEAIKGATLGWATAKDESSQENAQEPENGDNGGDNGSGGNTNGDGEMEG